MYLYAPGDARNKGAIKVQLFSLFRAAVAALTAGERDSYLENIQRGTSRPVRESCNLTANTFTFVYSCAAYERGLSVSRVNLHLEDNPYRDVSGDTNSGPMQILGKASIAS